MHKIAVLYEGVLNALDVRLPALQGPAVPVRLRQQFGSGLAPDPPL